jgi:hypothetical protein
MKMPDSDPQLEPGVGQDAVVLFVCIFINPKGKYEQFTFLHELDSSKNFVLMYEPAAPLPTAPQAAEMRMDKRVCLTSLAPHGVTTSHV